MFAEERQQKIYDIVCQRRTVKVTELSNLLEISEVTIRRDLDELQRQKLILRTHGGAMAAYSVGRAANSQQLIAKDPDLKRRIAQAAYDTINDYDTLLMDTSSTVFELVKLIASGNKNDLRIITTSLLAMQTLSECTNCKVMIVGGEVNYAHNTVEGFVAARFLKEIRVDKCFIGINGIDEEFGFSTPRFEDAEIKCLMIHSAVKSFILADHTKCGKVYLANVDPSSCLITDRPALGFSYETLESLTDWIFVEESAAPAEK